MSDKQYDFDLFVIGGGSGGVRAAKRFASAGKKVAISEHNKWGGTCVNVGCVPKKLCVIAGRLNQQFKLASDFGYRVEHQFDWQQLVERNQNFIAKLNGIYVEQLQKFDVKVIPHFAQIINKNHIQVQNKVYTADRILLATGTTPSIPSITGGEHFITSDDIFYLSHFPETLLINGGGYIALELASIFNTLGAKVTVVYRGDTFLKSFDRELVHHLIEQLKSRGIVFKTECSITKIKTSRIGVTAELSKGNAITASVAISATGRVANIAKTILPYLSIKLTEKSHIKVNSQYQTSVESIYAVGDCIGLSGLTPVAIKQAEDLITNWLDQHAKMNLDYSAIPTAVFTTPEIAQVGSTEKELKHNGIVYTVKTTEFKPLKANSTDHKSYRIYMKLFLDIDDKIIGATMLGEGAAEQIQLLTVLLQAKVSYAQLKETVAIHPTNAEEWLFL